MKYILRALPIVLLAILWTLIVFMAGAYTGLSAGKYEGCSVGYQLGMIQAGTDHMSDQELDNALDDMSPTCREYSKYR